MDSISSSTDHDTASRPVPRTDLSQDGSSVSTDSVVDGIEDAETEGGESASANEENEEDQVANRGNERVKVKGSEITKIFIFSVLVASSQAFLYGWQIILPPQMPDFVNATFTERNGVTPDGIHDFLVVVTVIYHAGGLLGALLSVNLTNTYGRRLTMIYVAPVMMASGLLGGLCRVARSPEMLVLARLMAGCHTGITLPANIMYVTEISPTKVRGAAGAVFQLLITVGIFAVQVAKLPQLFGNGDTWHLLLAMNCVSPICVFALFRCPDSPRFLFLQKHDEEAARKALVVLRGHADVEAEIDDMKKEAELYKDEGDSTNLSGIIHSKNSRASLKLACWLQIFQQLSGVNAVFNYSGDISRRLFNDAHVYMELLTSGVNILVTIPTIPLVEKLGRRKLIIGSTALALAAFLALTFPLAASDDESLDADERHDFAVLSIVLILLFIIGFATGLGPMPWILGSEVFVQKHRAPGVALSSAANWVCNALVIIFFPLLNDPGNLGPYVLIPFGIMLLACFTFIIVAVPYTKNMSFREIVTQSS